MAYEQYLADLEVLESGATGTATAVRISVERSYFGSGSFEILRDGVRASSLAVTVFAASAVEGSRALLIVPVRPTEQLDDIADGTAATAIGTLSIGRAIAFRIGEQLVMPAGPAGRPALRVPKLSLRNR